MSEDSKKVIEAVKVGTHIPCLQKISGAYGDWLGGLFELQFIGPLRGAIYAIEE